MNSLQCLCVFLWITSSILSNSFSERNGSRLLSSFWKNRAWGKERCRSMSSVTIKAECFREARYGICIFNDLPDSRRQWNIVPEISPAEAVGADRTGSPFLWAPSACGSFCFRRRVCGVSSHDASNCCQSGIRIKRTVNLSKKISFLRQSQKEIFCIFYDKVRQFQKNFSLWVTYRKNLFHKNMIFVLNTFP